jgi:hypothetical protein
MPLTGPHAPVACIDCHGQPGATPSKPVRFRFDELSYTACHEDPHKGQFRQRMLVTRSDGTAVGCQACHIGNAWREIAGFDHSATTFPLTGSHQGVACEKCHSPANPGAGLKTAVFASAPSRCSGCHDDVHAGQFAVASGETDCARCHGVSRFKQVSFDHSQTAFPLTGAHQNVKCAACHLARARTNGKSTVQYKGTPHQCEGCHKVEGQT